jgi:hypothetical protein
MNFLSTFFAIFLSSPSTPATTSCAATLLTDPGCEQVLSLSAYQTRQVVLIRNQTRRQVASLNLELRRIDAALQSARGFSRTRLLQRRAVLIRQQNRLRATATSRVNAMLSPWQRSRCYSYSRGEIHYRRPAPKPVVHVTSNRPPRNPPPRYQGNRRYDHKTTRRAPPSSPSYKERKAYNSVVRKTSTPKRSYQSPNKQHKQAPRSKYNSGRGSKSAPKSKHDNNGRGSRSNHRR